MALIQRQGNNRNLPYESRYTASQKKTDRINSRPSPIL
jgi:hypothetical protein